MGNIPLTSEGRIYAKHVLRELKRREPLDASVFAGKTVEDWDDAIFPIFLRASRDPHNPFAQNAMKSAIRRLEGIHTSPCHLMYDGPDIITMKASKAHTLTIMDGEREEGIIIQRHMFQYGILGAVICNVSDHTLGRFYERILPRPTIRDGITMALACGRIGALISSTQHLTHSDIYMSLSHGVVAVGNVKFSTQGNQNWASSWYDVRTVLPEEACDAKELAQAQIVNDCIFNRAKIEDVPFIPMRPDDYIMKLLEAKLRKPN